MANVLARQARGLLLAAIALVPLVSIVLTLDGRGAGWFEGLPNPFRVFVGHYDEVVDLPRDWQVIARSGKCPIHACVNESLRVFGVQFHPEMDLATGNHCFAIDAPALTAAGADVGRIIAESADDNSGDLLFARFISRCW